MTYLYYCSNIWGVPDSLFQLFLIWEVVDFLIVSVCMTKMIDKNLCMNEFYIVVNKSSLINLYTVLTHLYLCALYIYIYMSLQEYMYRPTQSKYS